ncbi:hypothetical protein ACP4OV_024819 [Aristida adscensionis]
MKMDRYATFVLSLLYLQSLCFVKGASEAGDDLVKATSIGNNGYPKLQGEASMKDITIPRPTMASCFAVSNDQGAEYNAIRAGLHTLPSLYKDTKLHMFAQWTTDRDWKTGCYNMDCPGFVPFNNTHPEIPLPGMVFDALSSYNQTDSSIILQIVKDERPHIGGGDWWLYRVIGPARLPLGHWPASLFTGMSRCATEAAWYGAVGYARRDDDLPAMGSGHGPDEGYTKAAYFADISLMDNMAYQVDPSLKNVAPMVNDERCYKIAMDGGADPPYRFFYGGPVSQSCEL